MGAPNAVTNLAPTNGTVHTPADGERFGASIVTAYCTVAGNVEVETADGGNVVTIPLQIGIHTLPFMCRAVRATNLTATAVFVRSW